MEREAFNRFVDQAMANRIVFYHAGTLDQDTVAGIGAVLRQRLQEEGATGSQSRKVFTAFMEMAQNILHYAPAEEPEAEESGRKYGALSVAREEGGFAVMCGNYLPTDQVCRVRGRLEAVQVMGPERVREAYRRQLAFEGADPDSKGAGLGLLTMAASARAPIHFAFDPHPLPEDGRTFLFLKALI